MASYIESVASVKKKTKEPNRVESLLPDEIRKNTDKLQGLLKDYYEYLNSAGNPTYQINKVNDSRNIDKAGEEFLDQLQKEIAVTVPKSTVADKVKLYKNLLRYYSVRGSTDSIELFFRIIFDDDVEVYYPQEDMLVPSAGKWQASLGTYADNSGFLSDTIKLQDSYFYQKFSYVIRTGNNVDTWSNIFNRLVHPAGFIFFGQILILLEFLKSEAKMPRQQPGYIGIEDIPLLIILEVLESSGMIAAKPSLSEVFKIVKLQVPDADDNSYMLHFYDDSPMSTYSDITFEDVDNPTNILDGVDLQDGANPPDESYYDGTKVNSVYDDGSDVGIVVTDSTFSLVAGQEYRVVIPDFVLKSGTYPDLKTGSNTSLTTAGGLNYTSYSGENEILFTASDTGSFRIGWRLPSISTEFKHGPMRLELASEEESKYIFSDWSVDDVINNKITWTDVELGVELT